MLKTQKSQNEVLSQVRKVSTNFYSQNTRNTTRVTSENIENLIESKVMILDHYTSPGTNIRIRECEERISPEIMNIKGLSNLSQKDRDNI